MNETMNRKTDFTLLSEPEFGWSTFSLPDVEDEFELSYLTDVAIEWLENAIFGLEHLCPFCVFGNLEPGRLLCTVSYWHCHLVIESQDREPEALADITHLHSNTDMLTFCTYLRDCIQAHVEQWFKWDAGEVADMSASERQNRKRKLHRRLARLSDLIESQAEHFGKNRFFF